MAVLNGRTNIPSEVSRNATADNQLPRSRRNSCESKPDQAACSTAPSVISSSSVNFFSKKLLCMADLSFSTRSANKQTDLQPMNLCGIAHRSARFEYVARHMC